MTCALFLASSTTVVLPIPVWAPVTSATLPWRSRIFFEEKKGSYVAMQPPTLSLTYAKRTAPSAPTTARYFLTPIAQRFSARKRRESAVSLKDAPEDQRSAHRGSSEPSGSIGDVRSAIFSASIGHLANFEILPTNENCAREQIPKRSFEHISRVRLAPLCLLNRLNPGKVARKSARWAI
eukprot:scaffold680_cov264-Pinguiococcus_pyrenoidosus.AAC.8